MPKRLTPALCAGLAAIALPAAAATPQKYWSNANIMSAPQYVHYSVYVRKTKGGTWQGGERQMGRETANDLIDEKCASHPDKPWRGNAYSVALLDTKTGRKQVFKCSGNLHD